MQKDHAVVSAVVSDHVDVIEACGNAERGDCLGLIVADLKQEKAVWFQDVGIATKDLAVKYQAVVTAVKCCARLCAEFGSELCQLMLGNVGGIGKDRIKLCALRQKVVGQNVCKDPPKAVLHAVSLRVACCD